MPHIIAPRAQSREMSTKAVQAVVEEPAWPKPDTTSGSCVRRRRSHAVAVLSKFLEASLPDGIYPEAAEVGPCGPCGNLATKTCVVVRNSLGCKVTQRQT